MSYNYNQLISDPSTHVKKRAQRSEHTILLGHMDDVVGTGPDEHLMSDFEHMKTTLHLTDVVVLRREGDTVNFLGLEITKNSKGFEVKKQYRPGGIPFESLRVGKLETDSQSWQTFDSDGARVSNSSGWFQLSHSRRKTHLHGTLETRHAICHETVDTTSQRHATHLSSS